MANTVYRTIKKAYIPDVTEGPTRKYELVHANDNGGRYYLSAYDVTLRKNNWNGSQYTSETTAIFANNDAKLRLDAGRWSNKKAETWASRWDSLIKTIDGQSPPLYQPLPDEATGLARLQNGELVDFDREG